MLGISMKVMETYLKETRLVAKKKVPGFKEDIPLVDLTTLVLEFQAWMR
jgi:hypothetical protein